METFLKKIMDRVGTRLGLTGGVSVAAAFSDLPPWPKAVLICVISVAYIASECILYWKGIRKP